MNNQEKTAGDSGMVRQLDISTPKNPGVFALLDASDFKIFSQFKWQFRNGYVVRTARISRIKFKFINLHREIMQPPPGWSVDHINGNPLDNRRENLRICTCAENTQNRGLTRRTRDTKYKGVKRVKRGFRADCAKKYLGTFNTEVEAARAYDAEAIERFGEFARTNVDLGLLPAIPLTFKTAEAA